MFSQKYLLAAAGFLPILAGCSDDPASPLTGTSVEPSTRAASHAPSATTLHFHLKQVGAQAGFATFDPATCVETDVFVFGAPAPLKEASGQPFSYVNVSQYNLCTDEVVRGIYAAAVDATFQTDSRLTEAGLHASMEGTDFVHETPARVTVDMRWTGTGDLLTQSQRVRIAQAGFLTNQWFKGTSREATAMGTVTVDRENLTPSATESAEIFRARAGELVVSTRR